MNFVEELGHSHGWRLRRARLDDGRQVFVKTGTVSPLFTSEAAGLRWLGSQAAEVVEAGEDRLVLEWIDTEQATPAAAERFGQELARTHALGAGSFGAPWPGFIAELPMDNSSVDSWAEFYATRRLLPFLRRARLAPGDVRLVERAAGRVAEVAGPDEPPSRIHGDLWNGNVLWARGTGVLIDPAAHGGHRETDLAMLALFGAPYLDRVLGAYAAEAPLADGWRARVPLHQLHPLLVHVCLYGEAYRDGLMSAVAKVLAL